MPFSQDNCPNKAYHGCHKEGPFLCSRTGELRLALGIQHPVTYVPVVPEPAPTTQNSQATTPAQSPQQSPEEVEEDTAASLPTPSTQATSPLPSKIDSDWQEVCSTQPRWETWWGSGKPQLLRKTTRDDDNACSCSCSPSQSQKKWRWGFFRLLLADKTAVLLCPLYHPQWQNSVPLSFLTEQQLDTIMATHSCQNAIIVEKLRLEPASVKTSLY
ncbi:hypothetical protein E2C01_043044 [Portunus trituberculatus]|uniref:Uncharacterized protein n=1 Tax=Portunus trituberculatus TaxID=210409 RepID=A0A5B7FV15_PORTR|nr:hypothetical protein [Portunus trituberculatus]